MVHRRADIDGLRAIAVVSVLLFHAKISAFKGGFVGVDVFFIISGFVITQTILRDIEDDRFTFLNFYARRAKRLLPALALVLVATLVAGWFLLWPIDYRDLAKQVVAGTLFVPNLLFWKESGYFDGASEAKPLLHLWSLGIEEQFYIVWPVIIAGLARQRRTLLTFLAIAGPASFLLCYYLTLVAPTAAFYSPLTRFWELSLGGSIAIIGIRPIPAQIRLSLFVGGILAIASAVLTFHPSGRFPGYQVALPTLGAAAIIYTGLNSPVAQWTLALRPIGYLGLISYPLYLWHWPILSLSRFAGAGDKPLSLLLVSTILAVLTYELIERKIQPLAPGAIWRSLWAGMATISVASLAVIVGGGLYFRYPADVVPILKIPEYNYGKDARLHVCWRETGKDTSGFPQQCTAPNEPGAILLVGDSHAGRLYPGLISAFGDKPIWQVTLSSCAPSGSDPACVAAINYAVEIATKQTPQYVILFAAWPNYTKDWNEATQATKALSSVIERFKRSGARVVVLGPAPIWRPSLPIVAYNLIETGTIPLRDKTVSPFVSAIDQQIKETADREGVGFFSVNDVLCNTDGRLLFSPDKPGEPTSRDYGHLTTAGAEFVAERLSKALNTANSASAVPK